MTTYSGEERRRTQRTKLVTFCPVAFEYNDHSHSALMIDVSELGAGFKISASMDDFVLALNEEIAYTVKTPYGESACKGRTRWARKVSDGFQWGVEFTEISKDEKDPLRALMDSPF